MNQQTIIISGGSRGLGLELVRAMLSAGYRVATFSRSPGDALAALVRAHADRLVVGSADAADSAAVGEFVKSAAARFGRIDGLVNNAGIARDGVLATMSDADIRRQVDANLVGTLLHPDALPARLAVAGASTSAEAPPPPTRVGDARAAARPEKPAPATAATPAPRGPAAAGRATHSAPLAFLKVGNRCE